MKLSFCFWLQDVFTKFVQCLELCPFHSKQNSCHLIEPQFCARHLVGNLVCHVIQCTKPFRVGGITSRKGNQCSERLFFLLYTACNWQSWDTDTDARTFAQKVLGPCLMVPLHSLSHERAQLCSMKSDQLCFSLVLSPLCGRIITAILREDHWEAVVVWTQSYILKSSWLALSWGLHLYKIPSPDQQGTIVLKCFLRTV